MSTENALRARRGNGATALVGSGAEVYVEIRFGDGISRLSDFDGITANGDIHVIVIDSTLDVAEQLRSPIADVCPGDALIVYVDTARSYRAVIEVLDLYA
ncbi:hypothetical protein [Paraburkholderia acidisoli]|uniref:Uncharacterized protein n=1 Tax=Paraburkholderia acidisoli TaxID=2571748 RepID=A0A7Z2GM11_9BURK|nr:hypothetical protein [Paraburkholderia acidisoli]QGZ64293.1 hypothetical protein FAZ98_21465 [Paraburkholderia acidisoli]